MHLLGLSVLTYPLTEALAKIFRHFALEGHHKIALLIPVYDAVHQLAVHEFALNAPVRLIYLALTIELSISKHTLIAGPLLRIIDTSVAVPLAVLNECRRQYYIIILAYRNLLPVSVSYPVLGLCRLSRFGDLQKSVPLAVLEIAFIDNTLLIYEFAFSVRLSVAGLSLVSAVSYCQLCIRTPEFRHIFWE
jgi:hypothetical protein